MTLVVSNVRRHILLRTYQNLVDKLDTGDPVTIQYLPMALDVVLTSGEVPHEITPIHEIELVCEEEAEILTESRLHDRSHLSTTTVFDWYTLHIGPLFISRDVTRITTEHTWKQHVQFIHILIFRIVMGDIITILFVRILFDHPTIGRCTLFGDSSTSSPLILPFHLRYVGLTIDQRSLSILFTRQIGTQRKDITGCILVHGGIGRSTNQRQCIRRVAHHNHHQTNQSGIQQLHIHLLLQEETSRQSCRQQDSDQIATANKRNTDQDNGQDKSQLHANQIHLVTHGLPNGPDQHAHQDHYVGIDTCIIGHTQHIDKEQFEVAAHFNQTLHDSIHHQSDNSKREEQGDKRSFNGWIRHFLIIINQDNGRDTQQVQQVHTDTQTHQIGNQDNPTIGMRLVSHLFPFQNQPENDSCKER